MPFRAISLKTLGSVPNLLQMIKCLTGYSTSVYFQYCNLPQFSVLFWKTVDGLLPNLVKLVLGGSSSCAF